MKKIVFVYILTLFCAVETFGQQTYFFSQYHQAAPAFNPSFTGINRFLDARLIHRNQWLGLEGAPTTNYIGIYNSIQKSTPISIKEFSLRISNPHLYDSILSAQPRIKEKIKHGVGGFLIYDTQSPFSRIKGHLNYSLHVNVTDESKVAFGLSVGIENVKIDYSKIEIGNDPDEFYNRLVALGGNASSIIVNPGISYYNKSFYIGYSATNLVNVVLSDLGFDDGNLNELSHNIQAGYQHPLNDRVTLQSSLYYYYFNSTINSLDVNVKLNINQKGYFGTTYRTTNDLSFMAGIFLQDKFQIAYSYDMKVSGRNDLNNGAHELTLGLMLKNIDSERPFLW